MPRGLQVFDASGVEIVNLSQWYLRRKQNFTISLAVSGHSVTIPCPGIRPATDYAIVKFANTQYLVNVPLPVSILNDKIVLNTAIYSFSGNMVFNVQIFSFK